MGDPQENESWKHEVASRLNTYRSRSQRKLSGDFSMRFNFEGETAAPRQQLCAPIGSELEPVLPVEAEIAASPEIKAPPENLESVEPSAPEPADVVPATPTPPPPLRPSVPFKRKIVMEANVIEFPRLFPMDPPPPFALAEPVTTTLPRILDAPEIASPLLETPILDGMRLEHLDPNPTPELQLPLKVASIRERVFASLYDGVIVLLATGVFGGIASKMLPDLDWTKPLLGAAALVPAAFWAIYQYLFIVYGARTPGMALARLGFSTFKGTAPNLRERRLRVIGIALSLCSLMLGFLWAFFDEDALCWHDRISRTYLFRQSS